MPLRRQESTQSNGLHSPPVIAQYQHVRGFHKLMAQWVLEPLTFSFARRWIHTLTGVDVGDEETALAMLEQQVERARSQYPTLFHMPGGKPTRSMEVSPRNGSTPNSTSVLPTDSQKLEEVLVCHLSASFLCMRLVLVQQTQAVASQHSNVQATTLGDGPLGGAESGDEGASTSRPSSSVLPLPLRPTPADLAVNVGHRVNEPSGIKGPPTGPATGAAPRLPPRYEPAHAAPMPPVDMGIARAVCRPGAPRVHVAPPPLVEVVQEALAQHEQRVSNTVQPIEEMKRQAAVESHLFFLDAAAQAKRRFDYSSVQRGKQEAFLEGLRSPRKEATGMIQYSNPLGIANPMVAPAATVGGDKNSVIAGPQAPRRPHTAGSVATTQNQEHVITHGSTSLRPRPVVGIVEATYGSAVRPFTARSGWSSRLVGGRHEGSSTTVATTV